MGTDRRDARSAEALLWRGWYKRREWKLVRSAQLARQPLCEPCLKQGRVAAATVVNHRIPHKGDWALFIDPNNHESTCKPCHDGPIQSAERRGFSSAVGPDGFPVDPQHRAYR